MVQTFVPTNNISLNYDIIFPVKLSVPAADLPVLTSSGFTFNSQQCFLQNKLNSTKIQIVSVDGTIENDNVGTYNQETGTVSLVGFKPSAIDGSFISLTVTPANQNTIRPLRNYVLGIDTSTSTSRALLDFQNTQVSI
jgi:hypothetical protein